MYTHLGEFWTCVHRVGTARITLVCAVFMSWHSYNATLALRLTLWSIWKLPSESETMTSGCIRVFGGRVIEKTGMLG
jgi:hypothetical protein